MISYHLIPGTPWRFFWHTFNLKVPQCHTLGYKNVLDMSLEKKGYEKNIDMLLLVESGGDCEHKGVYVTVSKFLQ